MKNEKNKFKKSPFLWALFQLQQDLSRRVPSMAIMLLLCMGWWSNLYLQEITWLIGIISFIGGIAIFLFKKIVIEPLQRSIDGLNTTLQEFKIGTDRKINLIDDEIDVLKEKTTRHDEQIKTLFKAKGDE